MTAPSPVSSARVPERRAIIRSTGNARAPARQVMRVGDRNRQRIGGVRPGDYYAGKQARDHRMDLRLLGIADADHRFLDEPSCIFADFQASARADHDHDAASLPELERRLW